MSKSIKIGLIKEGKNPPDKRVPFTPYQCALINQHVENVEVVVQSSAIRCFPDEQYKNARIAVTEDVSDCDILMGIKEVPVSQLVPGKTYLFFSHTIKEQPHNQKLMHALLDKNIRMIDYETLLHKEGGRIIGFGRYAGIVGAYNALRLYAEKYSKVTLKPAHACYDRAELDQEVPKITLPAGYKIVITGSGRVGSGCLEILHAAGVKPVSPEAFLTETFTEPVYTQLHSADYNKAKDGSAFNKKQFYTDPSGYESDFLKYALVADMYIPCHFWDSRSPMILTREDLQHPELKIKIIADISCDIEEPIASTIRASRIDSPFYGYDKATGHEVDHMNPDCIAVMAVDNLPCELPRNASEDFGKVLFEKILPLLIGNDPDKIIERATICKDGKLMPGFQYLEKYAYEQVK